MEVLRINYSFYTCFFGRVVIKVFIIDYGLYTYVPGRVVINLIVFRFLRELLGDLRADFRIFGSPRIRRLWKTRGGSGRVGFLTNIPPSR